jgi:LysM repeat protein
LKKYAWINLILVMVLLLPLSNVAAQDETPEGPVYIVKAGDSLWDIAIRFGISMDALGQANGISDPSQIAEGTQLVIPGLKGLQGILDTITLPYGETLRSISRQFQIPAGLFARLNRLSSPQELYAGSSIVLPVSENGLAGFSRSILAPEQSLLELAVLEGNNPWMLVTYNALDNTWGALPGDILLLPGGQNVGPAALPGEITMAPRSNSPRWFQWEQ